MATTSASFHTTGIGETTSPSKALNIPQNTTLEEIKQVFKLLLKAATISLHDLTKTRDEYIAGPEFGQKVIDLVGRVITDYLADFNIADVA